GGVKRPHRIRAFAEEPLGLGPVIVGRTRRGLCLGPIEAARRQPLVPRWRVQLVAEAREALLELADPLPHGVSHLRQPLRAEQEQKQHENDDDVAERQIAEFHVTSRSISTDQVYTERADEVARAMAAPFARRSA